MKYPIDFRNWVKAHPEIYRAFAGKAREMARKRKRYSARAIIHVIRWETDLRETDVTFKINNNWTPYLARLFMDLNPEYTGFFELRGDQKPVNDHKYPERDTYDVSGRRRW
jgi:hypothetical protein